MPECRFNKYNATSMVKLRTSPLCPLFSRLAHYDLGGVSPTDPPPNPFHLDPLDDEPSEDEDEFHPLDCPPGFSPDPTPR